MKTTTENPPDHLPPRLDNLRRVLAVIRANPESWDQGNYHSACGTKHCMSGWAQLLHLRNAGVLDPALVQAVIGQPANRYHRLTVIAARKFLQLSNRLFGWAIDHRRTLFELESLAAFLELNPSGRGIDGRDFLGYDRANYGPDGFDDDGFDAKGNDRHGENWENYDRGGNDLWNPPEPGRMNRAGFDPEGFDSRGFNEAGFDWEGRDYRGRDAEGLDDRGLDRFGFDRSGFDEDGLDRNFLTWEDRKLQTPATP
jgi:hypothetical protein